MSDTTTARGKELADSGRYAPPPDTATTKERHVDATLPDDERQDDEHYKVCPACQKPSTYDRRQDRFLHDDGSDNRSCWAYISSGRDDDPWWSLGDFPGPDSPEPQDGLDPMQRAVEYKVTALRIIREARRRLDDEDNPPAELPTVRSLDALLAEPDSPVAYRIDRLAPSGGRVMLSAQYKAGKTTLVANLVRALADAEPFLGAFDVATPARRLVLLDDELGDDMVRRWLREQHIDNTAAVADVVTLRGRLSSFNPADDRNRGRWAARLRDLGADYLVLDCLGPVLAALGIDENAPGEFLAAFDALLHDAGIEDSLMVHHMGHAHERSRGGSRLQDWPDAIWRVVRESDDPSSPRYFSAYGRDVDVREGRLSYDPATRRLSYANGSRSDTKAEAAQLAIVDLLAEAARAGGEPMSKNAIETEPKLCEQHTQKSLRAGLAQAVSHGLVTVEVGARRAKLHRIAHPCSECGMPVASGAARHQDCAGRVERESL